MSSIVHTEVHVNENWKHPLNLLANKYEATAVTEEGFVGTGKADSKAGAIAIAVRNAQEKERKAKRS
jgi:hypothetical protein